MKADWPDAGGNGNDDWLKWLIIIAIIVAIVYIVLQGWMLEQGILR